MTASDWAIVTATLVGPILAVQAQKWIERRQEASNRKAWVFNTLMATRGNRLTVEHVRALNMIDLAFYGPARGGTARRSKAEQAVLDSWREYLDHLSTELPKGDTSAFLASREELFINLIASMATERRYAFDRVLLRKGAYIPIAHNQLEERQSAALEGVAQVFSGRRAIKITPVPPDQAI
jgi:hypothetical protein